jgi:hypothetical protein
MRTVQSPAQATAFRDEICANCHQRHASKMFGFSFVRRSVACSPSQLIMTSERGTTPRSTPTASSIVVDSRGSSTASGTTLMLAGNSSEIVTVAARRGGTTINSIGERHCQQHHDQQRAGHLPALQGVGRIAGPPTLPLVAPSMRWRCDALLPQSEFTSLVDDGAALRWPDGGPRSRPMEEDRFILPRHDLRERASRLRISHARSATPRLRRSDMPVRQASSKRGPQARRVLFSRGPPSHERTVRHGVL